MLTKEQHKIKTKSKTVNRQAELFSTRKLKIGYKQQNAHPNKKRKLSSLKGKFKFWIKKQHIRKKKLMWWEKKKKFKMPKKYKALQILKGLNRMEKNKRINLKKNFKYTLYTKQALKLFYGNLKEKSLKKFCTKLIRKKNKLNLFVNFLESRLDCALVRLHFAPNFKVARQWIKNGGVCVNNKILKNVNYRVQVNDKIALNTLTVNVAFYLIQKKYDNLCWRYKVFFRRRRKGYLKNFWKYKKLKFSKTAWARSFVFFYNFPTNYTVNYNTFSAIQTSREFNILNLRLNKYLNNFKKTDKLFRIVLSHYLNKK